MTFQKMTQHGRLMKKKDNKIKDKNKISLDLKIIKLKKKERRKLKFNRKTEKLSNF